MLSGDGRRMSDYLGGLVARSQTLTPQIRPRLASLFEPPQPPLADGRDLQPSRAPDPPLQSISILSQISPPDVEASAAANQIALARTETAGVGGGPSVPSVSVPAEPASSPASKKSTADRQTEAGDAIPKTTSVPRSNAAPPRSRQPVGDLEHPEPASQGEAGGVAPETAGPVRSNSVPPRSRQPAGDLEHPKPAPAVRRKRTSEPAEPRQAIPASPAVHPRSAGSELLHRSMPGRRQSTRRLAEAVSGSTGNMEVRVAGSRQEIPAASRLADGAPHESMPVIIPAVKRASDQQTVPSPERQEVVPKPLEPDGRQSETVAAPLTVHAAGLQVVPHEHSKPAVVRARKEESPADAPVIRVTIGRVEVRAIMPPAPPLPPPTSPAPRVSLDEYLRQTRSKP
jgi:hypothetical protein